jgi:hypothetical protein
MKSEITPWDVLTSSGRYEDRIDHEECTPAVRIAAADLAERVSKLLTRCGLRGDVTSGFRTSAANGSAHAAKRSAHMSGEAVDLADPHGAIANTILGLPHVLEDYDLYMENPQYTKGWVHLSTRAPKSGNRIFIP